MQIRAKDWQTLWDKKRLTLIFGAVYVVLSLFAMAHFLNASFLGDRYFKTSFDGMVAGTTFKPFVYRQLVPSLARGITAVTPQPLIDWVNQGINATLTDPELETLHTTMPWTVKAFPSPGKHYPRVVTIILIYISLCGYMIMLAKMARTLFPLSPAMACFTPIFGVLMISSFSYPFQYIYDIPALFLSTACYYYLLKRRFTAYLIAFTLACLNKETAVFIFLFFGLWFFNRLDKRSYVNLLLAQYLIYALIRVGLVYIYTDNPGEYLKNHLFRTMPGDLLVTSMFDRVLKIAVIFFLLTFEWAKKPAFLKCGLWLLPPMYIAYLIYGMPGEYRVFFDVLPLPLLLAVHTLVETTGLARSPFFTRAGTSTFSSGVDHGSRD